MTSLETQAQTLHFPPILWPGTLRFGNYAEVLRQSRVREVVLEHHRRDRRRRREQPRPVHARGVRVRPDPVPRARGCVLLPDLATLMVPLQVVLIPTFLIVKQLRLLDRLGALIVPNLANVFGIFLLTQFFRTLPIELEEAARIDGASPAEDPVRDRAAAVAAGARDARGDPVPVDVERLPVAARHDLRTRTRSRCSSGSLSFQGSHATRQWHLLMAGNVMSMLPMLVLFIARAAVLRARHRDPGTQGIGWPGRVRRGDEGLPRAGAWRSTT